MPRSTLPKAYLRIDPNIDRAKADTQWAFIRLLCEANRQPRRGQFKSRALFDNLFGKATARKLLAAGDAVEQETGEVMVPGWNEWQEGDYTVGDRMRRMRDRRNNGVSSPSPHRIAPSPSTSSRGSTDKGVGQRASSDADISPIEVALSQLMRRSPAPRQLSTVEEMADELPAGIALATIENLIDERPERNVYGVLIDQLRDAKEAARPARNGHQRIGPQRNRENDYDALAEGA
jgi:hypothetical protein